MTLPVPSFDLDKFRKVYALMVAGSTDSEQSAARYRAEEIAAKAGLSLVDAVEICLRGALPAPSPGTASPSVNQAEDLFDDDVMPLPYAPGKGEKISVAAKVFRMSGKRVREKGQAFRIIFQTAPSANAFIDMPALSMILSQHWKALDAYKRGDHTSEMVRIHFINVEQLTDQWLKAQRAGGK